MNEAEAISTEGILITEPLIKDDLLEFFAEKALLESDGLDNKIWKWKPIPVREFIIGENYLNLKESIRPCVLEDICEFFRYKGNNPFDREYNEAVFCCGIGSGKSFCTSIITIYFIHLLLCLRNPQKYFGGDMSSKIAIINMSISETNATKVIFSEISSKINSSKWFLEKPWGLSDARQPDPNCKSELRFVNNLFVIPGSSSWRTSVGYNIIVGVMDEAASYRNTNNVDQAEDIFHALQRRLGSRFENKGAIIVAGSPLYESDFLEVKMQQAKGDAKIFARRRSLWESKYYNWQGEYFYLNIVDRLMIEVKPADMKNILTIPKVDFLYKAFKANPTKAMRDFGAIPSRTINSFFEQPSMVIEMINKKRIEDPVNADGSFKEWFKPIDKNAFHCIHIDLGIVKDAAGFCMCHVDGFDSKGSIKIYVDLVMRFQGSHDKPVQIEKLLEYIYTLKKIGFNIQLVTMDGFNSIQALQVLQNKGYEAEVLSVDRNQEPYQAAKEAIREGRLNYYCISNGNDVTMRVKLPNEELTASEVMVKELMTLEDIEGKKVNHTPTGTKDVSDSLAACCFNIVKRSDYFGVITIN
jgi:hypothetical protein